MKPAKFQSIFSIKKIVKIVLLAFMTLILSETFLYVYFKNLNNRSLSATELFNKEFGSNDYNNCNWTDSIGIHPYLAIYYPPTNPCNQTQVNNYGFKGHDIPLKKDTDFYTILITGGSSAEQIGSLNINNKENSLENILNSKWKAPNGKPFKVLNVAVPAAHHPIVMFQSVLFSEIADEVISYEGFNNFWNANGNQLIESQIESWQQLAIANSHPIQFALSNLVSDLQFTIRSSIFKNSFTAYWLLNYLGKNEKMKKLENSMSTFPSVPKSWTPSEKLAFIESRYQYYTSATYQHLKTQGLKFTIFIQPSPNENKRLTEEERGVIGDLDIYKDYARVKKNMNKLNHKNIRVENLDDIFRDVEQSIYLDKIHVNSKGVEIISNTIAERLALINRWTLL